MANKIRIVLENTYLPAYGRLLVASRAYELFHKKSQLQPRQGLRRITPQISGGMQTRTQHQRLSTVRLHLNC